MPSPTFTPNLNLTKLPPNYRVWAQLMNDNMTLLDAAISSFITFNNLQGSWANSTAYAVGDTVVDVDLAVLFTCQVDHISALIPTTFLEDRTANPTYWTVAAAPATNRGAWQPATAYNRNDFVLADGTKYAFCLVSHTSDANFNADLALGRWTVMIDLTTVGSLVLPVLSGVIDANKVVMTDGLGSSYVINTIAQLLALFTTTGAGTTLVLNESPTFTQNPVAPTQTLENNSTRLATTAYADTTTRAVTVRVQTFTSGGTYTPHSKMLWCTIECWGGGGGGGGCANTAANQSGGAGGGGSGGYSRRTVDAATIGASQVVAIGNGGVGGPAGTNGGAAGNGTSVGVLCIAFGGTGGAGGAGGASASGGAGASAGTGDIAGVGASGFTYYGLASVGTVSFAGGQGASSMIGAGGIPIGAGNANGVDGMGRASGGSGASVFNAGGARPGGDGTDGFVCITEYCYA